MEKWLGNEIGSDAPIEEGAKATLRRVMDTGKEENGSVLNDLVERWVKPAMVACRT